MKSQIKEIESHKPVAVAEPVYCPAFDWQKAIALAQDESIAGAGAHISKLTVSFAAAQSRPDVAYTAITPQAIDADHASLDHQPVELEVTEARSSYANPSWFPSGMTSEDYAAYTVATAGDATRTRVAIVVRLDTAASKLLDRTVPTDKLRVRGTARVPEIPVCCRSWSTALRRWRAEVRENHPALPRNLKTMSGPGGLTMWPKGVTHGSNV